MVKGAKQPYIYLFLGVISLVGSTEIFNFGGVDRYCSIIMRLWSLYHFYLILNHGLLKGPLKAFSLFVFVLITYSFIGTIQGKTYEISNYTLTAANYLNNTWMYASPVFSFYWFAKKNLIDVKYIKILTYCGIVFSVAFFITVNNEIADSSGNFGDTNNASYIFLQLFPLLLFFKDNRKIQFSLLFLFLVAIIISSKRGAILIAVVCLFLFYKSSISLSSKRNKKSLIVLSVLSLIVIVAFVFYELSNNYYFNEKILSLFIDKDTSGRDEYYSTLWSYYNILFSDTEKFLGKGLYGTIAIIGNYAHNDWLEYLISFGIVGSGCYGLYFYSLVCYYSKTRSNSIVQSNMLLLTIVILFMSSLFSMSFTGMRIFISFSLGYSIAYLERYVPNRR